MTLLRALVLFGVAALLEIGGCWLVWQGLREGRGWRWALAGALLLAGYGVAATAQPEGHFARVLAAYGGVFVVASLVWGAVVDGYRPDRYDLVGAAVCLAGMGVIMFAPRG